jgi:hypothetical protein
MLLGRPGLGQVGRREFHCRFRLAAGVNSARPAPLHVPRSDSAAARGGVPPVSRTPEGFGRKTRVRR